MGSNGLSLIENRNSHYFQILLMTSYHAIVSMDIDFNLDICFYLWIINIFILQGSLLSFFSMVSEKISGTLVKMPFS